MIASGASQVIVSFSAVVAAAITSLAVLVAVTGAVAMFVSVAAITALAAMMVVRLFDIAGGGGIEESLDVQS
jgi:uncharacterized membrane protein YhaH (DUF805 family)